MTTAPQRTADVIVIGAGAIGACTTLYLAKAGARVLVLEKEGEPALHQSGRNSGVIHAGYNLKPGSLKAKYCVEGSRRLRAYCREHEIPMVQDGILVVARAPSEVSVLEELKRRADANEVQGRLVDEGEIKELEPHVRGVAALHAPEGASFDSRAFVRRVLDECAVRGARVCYGVSVRNVADPSLGSRAAADVIVRTSVGEFRGASLVNCAGLHADRVAGDLAADLRVIPFRGYYAELTPNRRELVRAHVYAAPDLNFPFLGVHASRRVDGRVLLGPGAMLALGREAYHLWHIQPRDAAEILTWPGFYRFLINPGVRKLIRSELRKSLSLRAIWEEARVLLPDLKPEDLTRSFAGNRAQLVARDGSLVDDILVRETGRCVHVLNAVSPGLTCSLPFGKYLATRALAKLAGETDEPALSRATV